MKQQPHVFNSLDFKPVIDMLEPPHWWLQLWEDHTDLMANLSLVVIVGILVLVASFRVFVRLLTTGRIPDIERKLNEWDRRRMQKKDCAKKPTETDKETRNDDSE